MVEQVVLVVVVMVLVRVVKELLELQIVVVEQEDHLVVPVAGAVSSFRH